MSNRYTDHDAREDAEERPRARPFKRMVQSRATVLPPGEGNGTVTELFPNQSAVRLDGNSRSSLCNYRMSTLAFDAVNRERSPVCVNDRVRVEADVIVGRCERRNRLTRPAPNGRDPLLHVLAANLDCLVVVSAAHDPEFFTGLVDRFIVAASAQKIQPVLCINKVDLAQPGETRPWSHYPDCGITTVEISAKNGKGIETLSAHLKGKVAAFCGNSGVGKTSLLRRLLNDENYGKVGTVNQSSGKGRHTTSGAVLLQGPDGSSLIDTPGVMNFNLIEIAPEELLNHFPELKSAAVKCETNCAHDDEPACGLRRLPRYASYREIRKSLT